MLLGCCVLSKKKKKYCSCRVGVDFLENITIDLIRQRENFHLRPKELHSHLKRKGPAIEKKMNQQSQLMCNPSLDFQTISTPPQIQNRANQPTKAKQSVMDTLDGGGPPKVPSGWLRPPLIFFFFFLKRYIFFNLKKIIN
jgi:hypothetical protein